MTEAGADTSVDRFLGGRIELEQPKRGRHRAGLDAICLAAAVEAGATGRLVDLGAGVGAAGLAVAARVAGVSVALVERDPVAARLARANLLRPHNADFAGRCRVIETDALAPMAAREAAGLGRASADHVIVNPPFYSAGRHRPSPATARADAHVLAEAGLVAWVRTAASLLSAHGRLTLIFKGDGLADILDALAGRFGAAAIAPLFPREGEPAHRLIVSAVLGSRAATRLMPGLVLHPAGSNLYRPEADAILRGERGLLG